MVRVVSPIEETLTEQAVSALRSLVGQPLGFWMPWIIAHADGSFESDKMLFIEPVNASSVRFVRLEIEELNAPVTEDHYYRYLISEGEGPWETVRSANPSGWSYSLGANHSLIKSIDVYSYSSIADQIKAWPDLEELPVAQTVDYELLLTMNDGGRVSVKPTESWNLLYVTLKPSFELAHYKKKLGENLNLRLTLN